MKLIYQLKHAHEKLVRLRNHLTFLIRCRENKITPTGLKVTLPLRSPGVHKIARRTELALLRDVRYKKVMNEKGIADYNEQVRALVGEDKWKQLKTWCSSTTETVHLETKTTQMQKFERLQAKQHLVPQLDKDKLVKNLSSRNLTEQEKDVLALGLNFAVAPRQIPTLQIIAATESTATQLDKETAQQLRHRLSSILSTAKPPRSNLNKQQRESVRSL